MAWTSENAGNAEKNAALQGAQEPRQPREPGETGRLGRWLWRAVLGVTLLLTAALVLTALFQPQQAARGLLGLALLISVYVGAQQFWIQRLRRELATQQERTAALELRAERFEMLSLLDPLTGLYNRRFAEQRLAGELARSQRHGHPLSVLALDINNLKKINDRFGHAAGDLVLKEFAERLKKTSRGSDWAARMGGDEFVVLLPESGPEQAQRLLDRLNPLAVDFRGQKIPVTVAAGWAGYQPGDQPEQLLDRADRALYADKRSGAFSRTGKPKG